MHAQYCKHHESGMLLLCCTHFHAACICVTHAPVCCLVWLPAFLPWHRRYLNLFEEELQRVYEEDVAANGRPRLPPGYNKGEENEYRVVSNSRSIVQAKAAFCDDVQNESLTLCNGLVTGASLLELGCAAPEPSPNSNSRQVRARPTHFLPNLHSSTSAEVHVTRRCGLYQVLAAS